MISLVVDCRGNIFINKVKYYKLFNCVKGYKNNIDITYKFEDQQILYIIPKHLVPEKVNIYYDHFKLVVFYKLYLSEETLNIIYPRYKRSVVSSFIIERNKTFFNFFACSILIKKWYYKLNHNKTINFMLL